VLIPLGVGLAARPDFAFEPIIQSLCRLKVTSSLLPFGRSVVPLSTEPDFIDSSLLL
jgi:hypothetical protein